MEHTNTVCDHYTWIIQVEAVLALQNHTFFKGVMALILL
jgi:hypothetical protein